MFRRITRSILLGGAAILVWGSGGAGPWVQLLTLGTGGLAWLWLGPGGSILGVVPAFVWGAAFGWKTQTES